MDYTDTVIAMVPNTTKFSMDVTREIFAFLQPVDLNICNATCRLWQCILETYPWPACETRANYLQEQSRRYRWRKGHYRAATLNSVLDECVHSFRVCGDWVVTSQTKYDHPAVVIWDLQTCLSLFDFDRLATCFDLGFSLAVARGHPPACLSTCPSPNFFHPHLECHDRPSLGHAPLPTQVWGADILLHHTILEGVSCILVFYHIRMPQRCMDLGVEFLP